MDPVTAFGAAAGAAQLFDMSLNYSSKACHFIAAFRNAEKNAELLHQRLQEVNLLMRDLQRSCQPSGAVPRESSLVHYSIVEISKQFADDMVRLHELLPYDMMTFSTSIRKRAKFVLKEEDVTTILARLEGHKTAATLALQLAATHNDVLIQRDLANVQIRVQNLSSQQCGLSDTIIQQHGDIMAQSSQHRSQVVASIQELHERVKENHAAATNSQDTFSDGVTRGMAEMQIQIAAILAQQNTILAPRPVRVAEADSEATDADMLARLVRFELKHQLEPLLHRIDGVGEHIDRIATAFGCDAVTRGIFKAEDSQPAPVELRNTQQSQGEAGLHDATFGPKTGGKRIGYPRKVYLSSFTNCLDTGIGLLLVRLRTYRLRERDSSRTQKHFDLRATFLPRPWLGSRGLSATYSSGPNRDGYVSLAPRVAVINILHEDTLAFDLTYRALLRDDVVGFRQLLAKGGIGIWDVQARGKNLLEWAFECHAARICQYLLRDSGYGEQLVERGRPIERRNAHDLFFWALEVDVATAEIVLDHLGRFIPQGCSDTSDDELDDYRDLNLYAKIPGRPALNMYPSWARASMLVKFGYMLRPFGWIPFDLDATIYLLDLYLNMGGSPNATAFTGELLFQFALHLSFHVLDANEKVHYHCFVELLKHQHITAERRYFQRRSRCVRLLVLLLSAGADLTLDKACAFCTASADGIVDVLNEAVELHGDDPNMLHTQIHLALDSDRKLQHASSTGVDTSSMILASDISGLRNRTISRAEPAAPRDARECRDDFLSDIRLSLELECTIALLRTSR